MQPGTPGGADGRGFPCDWNVKQNGSKIELIIGKKSSKDARDLLRSFDLKFTICKTSFDGETFRVPTPHDTFNAKTDFDAPRYTVRCRAKNVERNVPDEYQCFIGVSALPACVCVYLRFALPARVCISCPACRVSEV